MTTRLESLDRTPAYIKTAVELKIPPSWVLFPIGRPAITVQAEHIERKGGLLYALRNYLDINQSIEMGDGILESDLIPVIV